MIQQANEGRAGGRPQGGFRSRRPFNKNKHRSAGGRGFHARDERGGSPSGAKHGKSGRSERGGRGGRDRMPRRQNDAQEFTGQHKTTATGQHIIHVPPGHVWNDNKLRIYCLGGLQEIGRNCTVVEYNDDIVIIDMGLQFPEEGMPGIDYIIPNISSLRSKAKNIRGVIITHGHFDHIGAIPHLLPKLGNPPMYMGRLTAGIVKARYEEFPQNPPLKVNLIDSSVRFKLGKAFEVEFVRMNHSIPDTFAAVIHTPVGTIMHTGDFKIDKSNPYDKPADVQRMKELAAQGVRVLMTDSTNAEHPGEQISEADVLKDIEQLFVTAPGRIFIGTFASMISRVQMVIELAEKYGRKVVIEGRSMHANVEVAKELGYLKFKPSTIVEPEEANRLPDKRVVVVGTGAQAQRNAFLMKLAMDEHRKFRLKAGDTVVFSSSVIPGNERTIQGLKDTLWRKGARVVHNQMMDVHAGGHCKQGDLKHFYSVMKPEFHVPIEAYHYMLRIHQQLMVEEMGHPRDKSLVADNGQIMEFDANSGKLTNQYVNTEYVFVDGAGVGDVSHIVLRDRVQLAEDGMLVVIAQVDAKTGRLIGSPDIISRGFIYMKENKTLIQQARTRIKKLLTDHDPKSGPDDGYLRDKLHQGLSQFFWAKTKRRPMIMPVIIEV